MIGSTIMTVTRVNGPLITWSQANPNKKIRALRAAEIRKGAMIVLTLRDKNGKPAWRGY